MQGSRCFNERFDVVMYSIPSNSLDAKIVEAGAPDIYTWSYSNLDDVIERGAIRPIPWDMVNTLRRVITSC